MSAYFLQADATHLPLADNAVALVLGSPPYMDARTYGINAQRGCEKWIDWMLEVTTEAVRVSSGLVIWVCAGVTRDWCYWPGPEGLLYRWWAQGGRCWRPCFWNRVGIPGSGGKQWYRADVEYCLAFTKCDAAIPWAEPTANGHPPKWAPGGEMSNRMSNGARTNQWGHSIESGATNVDPGGVVRSAGKRPSHKLITGRDQCGRNGSTGNRDAGGNRKLQECQKPEKKMQSRRKPNGERALDGYYEQPVLANPGNVIKIIVGGGVMGHKLAHDNEAPYPERLASHFIRSHCPKGGIVLDPFSGSGTTACAATKLGRIGIGADLRMNQCDIGKRRLKDISGELFAA